MTYVYKGIEFKEGDTVQHFHDEKWRSVELRFDGHYGWYIDAGEGVKKLVKDWDNVRENILAEPEGFKRIQLTEYASARVSVDVSEEVVNALKNLVEVAYENAEELILNVKKKS